MESRSPAREPGVPGATVGERWLRKVATEQLIRKYFDILVTCFSHNSACLLNINSDIHSSTPCSCRIPHALFSAFSANASYSLVVMVEGKCFLASLHGMWGKQDTEKGL